MSTWTEKPTILNNSNVDPRLDQKYVYIQIDSDNNKVYLPRGQNLLKLDSYLDELYKYYKLFTNETNNTDNLDEYATLILTNINKIIDMIKPCANSSIDLETRCSCAYSNSCTDNDNCMYVYEIQLILLDYILNLNKITNIPPKTDYDYLPFIIQKNTADIITGNKANNNMVSPDEYLLCSDIRWLPRSVDSELQGKYKKILTRMKQKEESHTFNFTLRYIIYGVVITSILCMLNIWYKNMQSSKEIK
jgi:hypothetical protein